MEVRDWLEERFSPVVAVAETPDALTLARSFGCSDCAALLRPALHVSTDVHVRTGKEPGDSNVSVLRGGFAPRVLPAAGVNELKSDVRQAYFGHLLRAVAPEELGRAERLAAALENIMRSPTPLHPELSGADQLALIAGASSPWFDRVSREYVHILRMTYFDCWDHPTALVVPVTTQCTRDTIADAVKSAERQAAAQFQRHRTMDQYLLRVVLLIHDARRSPDMAADAALVETLRRRLTEVLGATSAGPCHVVPVTIGRSTPPTPPPQQQASSVATAGSTSLQHEANASHWAVPMTAPWHADSFGVWCAEQQPHNRRLDTDPFAAAKNKPTLSPQDCSALVQAGHHVVRTLLVPFLEKRLRDMQAYIAENKQSALGKVASWFRDAKPAKEAFTQDQRYLPQSLEMQMRRAGDYCFMLRDYESAMYFFRLCRDELTSTLRERPFNRNLIAATQEAIALATLMLNKLPMPIGERQSTATADLSRLELARDSFTDASIYSFAFRCTLVLLAQCRTRFPPANDRAAALLSLTIGGGKVTPQYSAMLHEQLAHAWLLQNPPFPASSVGAAMVPEGYAPRCAPRKFAAFMARAAVEYRAADLEDHAVRCSLLAWSVLRHSSPHTWAPSAAGVLTTCAERHKQRQQLDRALVFLYALCRSGNATARQAEELFAQVKAAVLVSGKAAVAGSTGASGRHQPGAAAAFMMPLPLVHRPTVAVDANVFNSDEVTAAEDEHLGEAAGREWAALADRARGEYATSKYTFPRSVDTYAQGAAAAFPPKIPGRPVPSAGSLAAPYTVPLGETARIAVTMENPLVDGTPLVVQCASVVFVQLPQAEGGAKGLEAAAARPYDPSELLLGPTSTTPLHLEARSSHTLSLRFAPPTEGRYAVVGVRWITDGVEGVWLFAAECDARPRFDNAVVSNRRPTAVAFSHPAHLQLAVTPPQPRLSVAVNPALPPAALDGQVVRTALVVTNSSTVAACHARMVIAKCSWHLLSLEEAAPGAGWSLAPTPTDGPQAGQRLVVFEQDALPPGGEVTIRATFRAQRDEPLTSLPPAVPPTALNTVAAFVTYAAPVPPSEGKPSLLAKAPPLRMHKLLRRTVVQPSLLLSSVVTPQASDDVPGLVTLSLAAGRAASGPATAAGPGGRTPSNSAMAHNARAAAQVPRVASVSVVQQRGCSVFPLSLASLTPGQQPDGPRAPNVPAAGRLVVPLCVQSAAGGARGPGPVDPALPGAVYKENVVASIDRTSPSAADAALLKARATAVLGATEVLTTPPLWHFATTALACGTGVVGEDVPVDSDGLAFYADGGEDSAPPKPKSQPGSPSGAGPQGLPAAGGPSDGRTPAEVLQERQLAAAFGVTPEQLAAMHLSPALALQQHSGGAHQRNHEEHLHPHHEHVGAAPLVVCVVWEVHDELEPGAPTVGVCFHYVTAAVAPVRYGRLRPTFATSAALIAGARSDAADPTAALLRAVAQGDPADPGQCVLSIIGHCPPHRAGAFDTDGAQVAVPMHVAVTNHGTFAVNVELAANAVFGTALAPHPTVVFVGRTKVKLSLLPGAQSKVSLTAAVFAPGVYNFACTTVRAVPAPKGSLEDLVYALGSPVAGPAVPADEIYGTGTVHITGFDVPWLCTVAHDPAADKGPVSPHSPTRARPSFTRQASIVQPAGYKAGTPLSAAQDSGSARRARPEPHRRGSDLFGPMLGSRSASLDNLLAPDAPHLPPRHADPAPTPAPAKKAAAGLELLGSKAMPKSPHQRAQDAGEETAAEAARGRIADELFAAPPMAALDAAEDQPGAPAPPSLSPPSKAMAVLPPPSLQPAVAPLPPAEAPQAPEEPITVTVGPSEPEQAGLVPAALVTTAVAAAAADAAVPSAADAEDPRPGHGGLACSSDTTATTTSSSPGPEAERDTDTTAGPPAA